MIARLAALAVLLLFAGCATVRVADGGLVFADLRQGAESGQDPERAAPEEESPAEESPAEEAGEDAGGAAAPEELTEEQKAEFLSGFSKVLGLSDHLELTPKILDGKGANDTTAGVEYEYERSIGKFGERNFEFFLQSRGVLTADPASSPERRLEHRVRVSIWDIFGAYSDDRAMQEVDPATNEAWRRLRIAKDDEYTAFRNQFRRDHYVPWLTEEDPERRQQLFEAANKAYREKWGQDLKIEQEDGGDEKWTQMEQSVAEVVEEARTPFVTLWADVGAESDQQFRDVQYVGAAGLRGKISLLATPLDFIMQHVRGYERVFDYVNHDGGVYFWATFDAVDASQNESRKAVITSSDDEQFTRFSGGLSYRNELFNLGSKEAPRPVGLELEWRYHREFNAPASIKAIDQDETSWFRATVLFPDDMLIEYTDGKQPLDLTNGSTIFLGWRVKT